MRIHHRCHAAGNNIPLTGRAMTLFATQPPQTSSSAALCLVNIVSLQLPSFSSPRTTPKIRVNFEENK